MKAQIHPTWYPEAKISCACGNSFSLGSTVPELRVEVCYKCHPFYTGQMKYVDTAGRVEAFKTREAGAQKDFLSKAEKRRMKKQKKLLEELERPDTLEALRQKG